MHNISACDLGTGLRPFNYFLGLKIDSLNDLFLDGHVLCGTK